MLWNPATRWLAKNLNWVTTQVPPPPRSPDDVEKRKILLVHAHPRTDSYSHALADAVEAGAKEGGHTIRRRDLYKERFSPVMTAAERGAYLRDFDMVPKRLASDVRSHLDDLRWADSVVFVYPTWWFNVPAMLKGYIDRVMVPATPGSGQGAWAFPDSNIQGKASIGSGGLVGHLTNVKRVAGISTYGSERYMGLLAGDNGRNMIGTGVRALFDPSCTVLWMGLYSLDFCSDEQRADFIDKVRETIRDDF